MAKQIDWHRVFGLTLTDFFTDSDFQVELEKELTFKKQFLDVVIIKKTEGKPIKKLPDGLDKLAPYNLLTYKSLREPFNEWALSELIGHYVNYRKQISPSLDDLLPVSDFKLYAVSTRYPHNLSDEIHLQKIQDGVYDIKLGFCLIRLIVLSRMPKTPENALWQLFGGKADKFVYGDKYYHWHYSKQQSVLNRLYELYQQEGVSMSYTWEDFERDYTRDHLHLLSPDERLKGVPTTERLKGVPTTERLKGIPRQVIEEYLSQKPDKS